MTNQYKAALEAIKDFGETTEAGQMGAICKALTILAGEHPDLVVVPRELSKEMAWELENNIAEPLKPSVVHQANWSRAYTALLAEAPEVGE